MLKISWEFFCKRQGVSPAAFVKRSRCTSYAGLVNILESRGVVPPLEKDVKSLFKSEVPVKNTKVQPKTPSVKPVVEKSDPPKAKKKVSRRPRSTKQKLGVAAKNNAGSKDAPKSDS